MGLVGGEIEQRGLMDGPRVAPVFPAARPVLEDFLHQLGDCPIGTARGAEVEGSRQLRIESRKSRVHEAGAEPEVAGKRFEHVLPGAGGDLVAHRDRRAGLQATNAIWDDAIGCPIAPADDVAGSG